MTNEQKRKLIIDTEPSWWLMRYPRIVNFLWEHKLYNILALLMKI